MPATLEKLKRAKRTMSIRPFGGSLRLSATVEPERSGGYSCFVPTFPGCISCGGTLREARSMITEAAEACLLTLVGMPAGIHVDSFGLPDGRTVRRKDGRAISVWIDPDEEPGFVSARSHAYGVDVFAADRDELDELVRQALAVNWTEYAEAPDSALTREARELKRRLLDLLEVARDA